MVDREARTRWTIALLGVVALTLGAYLVLQRPPDVADLPAPHGVSDGGRHVQPGLEARGRDPAVDHEALELPAPLAPLDSHHIDIAGLCIDAEGDPVADATVAVLAPQASARFYEDATLASTRTDAAGRFRFAPDAMPAAPASARLIAWQGDDELSTAQPLETALPPKGELVLELSPSRTVTGRVALEPDVPVSSIRVKAVSDHFPEHPAARIVSIDEEGRFAIAGCRRFVHVQAIAPGRQPSGTALVMLDAPREEEPVLVLGPPGVRARLRLVDEQGAALPRGVQALAGVAGSILTSCTVGDDGLLDVEGIDPTRPLRLSIPDQRDGRTDSWLVGTYADVPPESLRTTPPWTLAVARSLSVTVRLLDFQGEPIPDMRLVLVADTPIDETTDQGRAVPGKTDARGQDVLSRDYAIGPGAYTLRAADGGHILWSGHLKKSAEELEIQWAGPHRTLELFDCRGPDGRSLQHTRIGIEARQAFALGEQYGSARVGRDLMAPDGVVRLLVFASPPEDGHPIEFLPYLADRPLPRGSYEITPPRPGARGLLQLQPGAWGSLTLELRRGDHPIRDAYALLRGEGGRVLNAAEPSDPEGLVRFGVVPAGEWRIEIRSGSTSTFLRSPIDIAADVTATRTIDLARAR
ncbi:MAG: carboxypeptidase-like regulatory domain-containing protein [Planctomycetota bacterium]